MRGLVMEVKKDHIVVLTPQGEYLRLRNDGTAAIGDSVPCSLPSTAPKWHFAIPRRLAAAAASLMLLTSAGLGAYGYSQPFGVVTVDINPSVAITYNWFSRVLSVEALNPEAVPLVTGLQDLRQQPVNTAVERIVTAASDSGLLDPALSNVVFIAVSDRTDSRRADALMKSLAAEVPPLAGATETVLMTGSTDDYQRVHESHESQTPELIRRHLEEPKKDSDAVLSDKPLKEILKNQQEQRQKALPTDPRPEAEPDRNPNAPDKNAGPKQNQKDLRDNRETPGDTKNGPPEENPGAQNPGKDNGNGNPNGGKGNEEPPSSSPPEKTEPGGDSPGQGSGGKNKS